MNTPDDDRDAELTTDWPGTQRGAATDDGEATTVVPKTPQQSTSRPISPPPPPPMSPPQAGQWDPRWQTAPGPGSPPPPGGGAWAPPVPPGPYPPSPYPPVAPKPPKGPRWGLLSIGALALVVIAVAVTVFVTRGGDSPTPAAAPASTSAAPISTTSASASASAPSTGAAPPTGSSVPTSADVVDPTALKGLLASVADVTQLADNAMMTPQATQTSPLGGAIVVPDSCTGAVMPGLDSVYRGAGFTGFAVQVLSNEPRNVAVIQSLASFPSEAEAQSFVDGQFADWQACKYTDVTVTIGSSTSEGKVAISANTLGTNNVFIFPPTGTDGRQCQHAMSARKNAVVDVRVCAPSVGSMGWTLARDIGEKITGQR
jgi:serine/threonine kinase PknH